MHLRMGSKWLQVSDIEILNISCQWYGLLWYDWVLIKVGINQIIFYELIKAKLIVSYTQC